MAGKYWFGFGVPFDLEELKDAAGLDITKITHVKIVDVIGTINPLYASKDSKGKIVNDPYPTDFPSGGFDLDAVGIIHQGDPLGVENSLFTSVFSVYPNPSSGHFSVKGNNIEITNIQISDLYGNKLAGINSHFDQIDVSSFSPGTYIVEIYNATAKHIARLTIN